MRYTIIIEEDEVGGYRAIIEDWFSRAGHGDTPSEAIISAVEYADEWLDSETTEELPDVQSTE